MVCVECRGYLKPKSIFVAKNLNLSYLLRVGFYFEKLNALKLLKLNTRH